MLPNSMLCAPQGSTCHTTLSMSAHSSFSLLDWKLLLAGHFICICWVFLSPPTHTHSFPDLFSACSSTLFYPEACLIWSATCSHALCLPVWFQWRRAGAGKRKGEREKREVRAYSYGTLPTRLPQDGCVTPCKSQGNISTRLSPLGFSNRFYPLPLRPRWDHGNSALPSLGYHSIPCRAPYLPLWINPPPIILTWVCLLVLLWLWPTQCLYLVMGLLLCHMILLLRIRTQLHGFIFWT